VLFDGGSTMTDPDSSDINSSWCSLVVKGASIRAKIKHVGGGKYRILEDKNDGKYVDTVVDTLDIYHCNL
jgi:hypothetical protein